MRALILCLALSTTARAQDAPPPPFPDIRALMLEVEANQKRFDDLARDYTYHVHVDQTDLNGDGSVKKRETTDSESFTIDNVRVNKKVLKDGKPLTAEEAAKENDRIDKEVADAKKNQAKLDSKGKPTNDRGQEVLTVSRILELGSFTGLRAGDFNGRPAWIADYAGDPNAKTHSEFEKAFRDLVGTVWIDQHDHTLMAARGHFLKDFKIGFGLIADIHKNSEFSFHTVKVGEAWLPADIAGSGKMSYLLFGGFNGTLHISTSNYKRFRAAATIRPSNNVVDENGNPIPEPPPAPNSSTTP